jgi:hypothetical protein
LSVELAVRFCQLSGAFCQSPTETPEEALPGTATICFDRALGAQTIRGQRLQIRLGARELKHSSELARRGAVEAYESSSLPARAAAMAAAGKRVSTSAQKQAPLMHAWLRGTAVRGGAGDEARVAAGLSAEARLRGLGALGELCVTREVRRPLRPFRRPF